MTRKTRKKKGPAPVPKPRHVWKIKPHTQVKPSEKIYHRPAEKKKQPSWVNALDWFGDQ